MGLARLGDHDAFARLVDRHQSRICGLTHQLSANAALADDLAQQTFLDAWRGIGKLREPRAFHGWLQRIAVNLWLKQLRNKDPAASAVDIDVAAAAVAGAAVADDTDINIDLQRALSELTDIVRTCVVLSLITGLTHAEIASLTAIPLGTVKSHIRRGSLQLRTALAPYRPEST